MFQATRSYNGGGGQRRRQRGFVLLAAGAAALVLTAALGMAVDMGRMYVVRSEAQNFADSVALEAALELDGTIDGLNAAAGVAARSTQKYDLGRYGYEDVRTEFAPAADGPWGGPGASGLKTRFVRVTAETDVRLYFLSALLRSGTGRVAARAVAAQVVKRTFSEGLFPFSPFAHDTTPPHFGLTPGEVYTLRWPSTPKLQGNSNVCGGDQVASVVDIANAQGGSERGYIEESSADVIRQTIINDYQSITRTIGDLVSMSGGAKQSQLDSLLTRIAQDSDPNSLTYAQYQARGEGSGRRIIACPINDGGTPPGSGTNRIVSIGAFFLRPTGEYGNGGNQSWCAEYIGAWVQGSNTKGVEESGAWVVRLVK